MNWLIAMSLCSKRVKLTARYGLNAAFFSGVDRQRVFDGKPFHSS